MQAMEPNQVWTMDFISVQLFDGRRLRILTILESFTRVSQSIEARMRYCGADLADTFERVKGAYGLPKTIRIDNGPEFTGPEFTGPGFISEDLDLGAHVTGLECG